MAPIFETLERWPHWIDTCPDRWDMYLAMATSGCAGRAHLTKEEFLKWFPMFADAPEEWIEMLLKMAREAGFNPSVWGSWLKWGEALFVAHYLSMREMHLLPGEEEGEGSGGAGVIASSVVNFRAGSVAWSKDTSIEAKLFGDPMMQTIFGQKLLDLIRTRIAVGLVTVT
jgi:hypothetical protein